MLKPLGFLVHLAGVFFATAGIAIMLIGASIGGASMIGVGAVGVAMALDAWRDE